MGKIGIYKILSKKTNRVYIGSTIDLVRRWREHKKLLKGQRHHSSFLQNHYNKYGIGDLEFIILEKCNKENLIDKEQFYLDTNKCEFNVLKIAYSVWGFKHSKETKDKISKTLQGHVHSSTTKDKISKALKGKERDVKLKIKLSIPVEQYDLEGNFIKEWFGANEAARYINGNSGHIIAVCKGKRKTHKKYKWKYKWS